ncbi:hypothetical protein MTR67_018739 [Solanum verrucosum]|uniref:Reverse transcriptase domain-containing protein n=1 Tax=Solanum verrucosum TaxID=315347 RepID=A0AAF0QSW5_SOLVR|nr:hypothetical protein MTR67_018739 [Solanum verrucosum]
MGVSKVEWTGASGSYPSKDTSVEPLPMDYVFPTNLPRVPPDRDIDFAIDLEPGTKPISIPLYYMAPTKLKEYKDQDFFVFIDEILVDSKNEEDRDRHLRIVLQRLKEEKLYAKFSKCKFWLDSMAFLGRVLSKEGINVNPAKIEVMRGWKRPTLVTKIQSFVGRKTNVVADALSRKTSSMRCLASISVEERSLARDVQRLANSIVCLWVSQETGGLIAFIEASSPLVERHFYDENLCLIRDKVIRGEVKEVVLDSCNDPKNELVKLEPHM